MTLSVVNNLRRGKIWRDWSFSKQDIRGYYRLRFSKINIRTSDKFTSCLICLKAREGQELSYGFVCVWELVKTEEMQRQKFFKNRMSEEMRDAILVASLCCWFDCKFNHAVENELYLKEENTRSKDTDQQIGRTWISTVDRKKYECLPYTLIAFRTHQRLPQVSYLHIVLKDWFLPRDFWADFSVCQVNSEGLRATKDLWVFPICEHQ